MRSASPLAPKQWDPVRYGSLSPPGDDWSFDIFSQAAEAVLDPTTGTASSTASGRRSRARTALPRPRVGALAAEPLRDGSTVVEPDSGLFRLWEPAGPAHAPNAYSQYQNSTYVYSHSNGAARPYDHDKDNAWGYNGGPGDCVVRNFFNASFGYQAQLVALDHWVRTGKAPKPMPRTAREGRTRLYDEHDNVLGGIRTPQLAVPIAGYFAGGAPTRTTDPCALAGSRLPLTGTTHLFGAATLEELYPERGDDLRSFEGAAELRERAVDAAAYVDAAVR